MECNKDEAIRAKQIAEKKLESLDFEGARKMAQKAQSLHPSLENISQILSICGVQCSAQTRILGSEKDWYGILQVEKLADEPTVRKQYRKLALHLHPDKNRFPGAEAAFKCIVEANMVLSDPTKKAEYDNQILAAGRPSAADLTPPPHHTNANQTSRFNRQRGAQGSNWAAQTKHTVRQEMFVTSCPFCGMKHQQPRTLVNTLLTCHSCMKTFTGHEMNPAGSGWVPPVTSQTGDNFGSRNSVSREVSQWRAKRRAAKQEAQQGADASGVGQAENASKIDVKEKIVDGCGVTASHGGEDSEIEVLENMEKVSQNNVSRKRRRQVVSSSESLDSPCDSDQEKMSDKSKHDLNSGLGHGQTVRRSSRTRKNITHTYTGGDDYNGVHLSPRKRSRPVSKVTKEVHKDTVKRTKGAGKGKGTRFMGKNISGKGADAPKSEIDDPEFNNFDKFRDVSLFAANQIWACYDSSDSMPRFHAKVKKVSRVPFEMSFIWLEPNPVEDDHKKWVKANLPVSCGTFKLGKTAVTDTNHMFSHQVIYEKGNKRGSFIVYPKPGEVWALFKDWDLNWSSHPESHRGYKYEIVEILLDFDAVSGLKVCYLEKVADFPSIFKRRSQDEAECFLVLPNELYKFSHQIPSYKMTGSETEGVPAGSFELDTASIPLNHDDMYYHQKPKKGKKKTGHGANWARPKSG